MNRQLRGNVCRMPVASPAIYTTNQESDIRSQGHIDIGYDTAIDIGRIARFSTSQTHIAHVTKDDRIVGFSSKIMPSSA
jgi:hypothetical protein